MYYFNFRSKHHQNFQIIQKNVVAEQNLDSLHLFFNSPIRGSIAINVHGAKFACTISPCVNFNECYCHSQLITALTFEQHLCTTWDVDN